MTPIAHLSRRYRFSASHRLHVDALSPERNREVFGKCNNPHGHGHNYIAQVTFAGPVDAVTGMVLDLGELDGFARRELLDVYDQANLNTLPAFLDEVPSTENVCVELWRLFNAFPHATLRSVHVEETGNNSFDYFGETSPS